MAAIPNAILLQARKSDDTELEPERRLFAERLGLPAERMAAHNLLTGAPRPEDLAKHDLILIGGSGDFFVSNGEFPNQEKIFDSLRETVEGPRPIFASCFGFHLITAALGGEIIHDPGNVELGTMRVDLTEAGRSDELFGSLPKWFMAQLGRKDRAQRLPVNTVNLASSDACPYQAFRCGGRAVWATQFHPELDRETNLRRYLTYASNYRGALADARPDEVLQRFKPSPETHGLLRRFLDLVLG